MTRRAIALRMTRRAGFEALPSRLAVSQIETTEGVVKPGGANAPRRDYSRLLVAALTELRGIVAVAAARGARVGGAGVTRKECGRVVARLRADIRAMAVETHRADVTGLARARTRVRLRTMTLPEVPCVARWGSPDELRARRAVGAGRR